MQRTFWEMEIHMRYQQQELARARQSRPPIAMLTTRPRLTLVPARSARGLRLIAVRERPAEPVALPVYTALPGPEHAA